MTHVDGANCRPPAGASAGRRTDAHGCRRAARQGRSAPSPVARDPVRLRNSDVCFVWDGPIGGAVEHLAAVGVEIEVGPVARGGARGDGQSVYFRDPDGTLVELISYTA